MKKIFDRSKFSNILETINSKYNNMTEFAKIAKFDRSYISKYIHIKLDNPPSPKILERIANASKNVTTYDELMQVCGYTNYMVDMFFDDNIKQQGNKIPIAHEISYDSKKKKFNVFASSEYISANFELENDKEYFAYRAVDKSMYPLLDIADIAIIEKCNLTKNGKTYLLNLDNQIYIRKIIQKDDKIQLQAMNACIPVIELTNEELEKRNFAILGKVIRAENKSAFE